MQVTGEYSRPEDSDELKRVAVDLFKQHGYSLFLVDLTHAEIFGGTMRTYTAANPQGEIVQSLRKFKTAFVRRQLSEDDRFFETVASNRGYRLRAFDTLDKAVEWLTHAD